MALGGSLAVPAVRTLGGSGPEGFRYRLYAFGFKSLTDHGEYYGFSLALGSAEVALLMLANGYRTLANGGEWSPLRVTRAANHRPCVDGGCSGVFGADSERSKHREFSSRRVADAAPVFIVADILADRAARVGTFGLESWLATPYWSCLLYTSRCV